MNRVALPMLVALMWAPAGPVMAADGGSTYDMLYRCTGSDATVEIFAVVDDTHYRIDHQVLTGPVRAFRGFYARDLTSAGKGKELVPVALTASPNRQSGLLDRLDGYPPTVIPVKGGLVAFDPKWTNDTKCKPAGWHGYDDE